MKANDVIKLRRQELGLTQKEVANLVGVTEATVSRWESGDIKNMKRDKIATLSRVLDIPPAVLMDWEAYDAETIERRQLTREFDDLLGVAELDNIKIALELLKRLEGR